MARVKRGVVSHKKHKKTLEYAKGYRMARSKHIKAANEAVLHAGEYAYAGRKQKKRQMREIWIMRINASCKSNGTTYSSMMAGLQKAHIELDRKMLSALSERPEVFTRVLKSIQSES